MNTMQIKTEEILTHAAETLAAADTGGVAERLEAEANRLSEIDLYASTPTDPFIFVLRTAALLLRQSAGAVANALVESKREWSAVVQASVETEREACAEVADGFSAHCAEEIARRIRSRGKEG